MYSILYHEMGLWAVITEYKIGQIGCTIGSYHLYNSAHNYIKQLVLSMLYFLHLTMNLFLSKTPRWKIHTVENNILVSNNILDRKRIVNESNRYPEISIVQSITNINHFQFKSISISITFSICFFIFIRNVIHLECYSSGM